MNISKKIKISIVVPVYNVESFIKQCLDSIVNQTLKNIEIIIINDCSTDNSGIICDEYAEKDGRLTVIHNEQTITQGPSRNKGIEISKGEYVGFVDPDDWVDLDFFETLYNTAKKNKSDIVKAEPIKVFPNGAKEIQTTLNTRIKEGLKKKLPLFLLFTYEHWSAIFKREVIINNKVIYPNIRTGEDVLFLLNVTYYSETISLISGTNYFYRQHQNSLVSIREKPYFESILHYFNLLIHFINSHEMEKTYYDLVFSRGFSSVKNRYKEMDTVQVKHDFKRMYVEKALNIMNQYKYDAGYLLDSFFNEFTYEKKKIQQLKRTNAYRIGKVIIWLPSKIKNFLNYIFNNECT